MIGRFLPLALLLTIAAPLHAATLYVSPSGSDGGPCSQAAPCRTPAAAIRVMRGGDTLVLRGGTYDGISTTDGPIPSGTSWDNATTFQAAPGETVILGRLNLSVGPECGSGSLHYVIFDGIIFDGQRSIHTVAGVCGANASHIRLQNGEVRNATGQGIHHLGTHSEVINMKVHDNGTTWFDHGIYFCDAGMVIRDSEFYNNAGYGIHLYESAGGCGDNIMITNNRIYNNHYSGVTLNHGAGIVFEGNCVAGHTESDGWAIQIDRGARGTRVANNTLLNNRNGVQDRATGTQLVGNTEGSGGVCPALVPGTPPTPTKPPAPRPPVPKNLRVVVVP